MGARERIPHFLHERTGRSTRPPVLLPSIRNYRRADLGADVAASLALLAIAIPEQLATSRLAGMPPLTGFYAFVAGSACFALLGTNRQLSVGADSTIAPLFAVGVGGLAASGSARYVDLVGIVAVSVGVIVVLVGLLRLGWIAQFLSTPVITGFLTGVAVIIVVHQLPDFLGLPAPGGSAVHRIAFVAEHVDQTNLWSLGIGVTVLALVTVADRLDRRIPAALVGLIGSTAVVGAFDLQDHGVAVLGTVVRTAPRLGLVGLSWTTVAQLLPLAAVVALVVVSQSAATTRAFADAGRYSVDVDRDFIGVGAGSIVAGLVGSFPVDASPPRTAAVATAGGRSQLSSIGAAAAMVALVPAAGLLSEVPLATLAAVLLFIASRIVHVKDLVAIARFSPFELALAAIATLTVALVGVEQGIAVAVGLAIVDRARLAARPQLHVLGRVPGTTSFAPLSSVKEASQVPGVLVVLFATPLWYANATQFRAEMEGALQRAVGTLDGVVLDTVGMTDIDFTGMAALRDVLDVLERRELAFYVARAGARVRRSLARAGVLDRIGEDRFFGTVGAAVAALTGSRSAPGAGSAAVAGTPNRHRRTSGDPDGSRTPEPRVTFGPTWKGRRRRSWGREEGGDDARGNRGQDRGQEPPLGPT